MKGWRGTHHGNGDLCSEIAIRAVSLPKVVNQVVNRGSEVVNRTCQSCESAFPPAKKLWIDGELGSWEMAKLGWGCAHFGGGCSDSRFTVGVQTTINSHQLAWDLQYQYYHHPILGLATIIGPPRISPSVRTQLITNFILDIYYPSLVLSRYFFHEKCNGKQGEKWALCHTCQLMPCRSLTPSWSMLPKGSDTWWHQSLTACGAEGRSNQPSQRMTSPGNVRPKEMNLRSNL